MGYQVYMYNTTRAFKTLAAAKAFREGVDFVNDSAITVVGIKKHTLGNYRVYLLDEDSDQATYEVKL